MNKFIAAFARPLRLAVFTLTVLLAPLSAWSEPDNVDINSASAEQLAAVLVGVGESKARAIVAYREQHGAFARVEDLVQVKGIGEALISRNRALMRVE